MSWPGTPIEGGDSGPIGRGLSLLELTNLVKSFMSLSGSSHDTLIHECIYWAQMEMARQHRWRGLKTTYTGSTEADEEIYTWPADLRTVQDFCLTGDYARQIQYISVLYGDAVYPDLDELPATGPPIYAIDYGSTYHLIPKPDAVYPWRLRCEQWPAVMTDDAEVPDLRNMDDLIVYLASMHLSIKRGLLENATALRRMVYTAYPNQRGAPYGGLMKMCIRADKDMAHIKAIKRPYYVEGKLPWPSDYMTNPRVGLSRR